MHENCLVESNGSLFLSPSPSTSSTSLPIESFITLSSQLNNNETPYNFRMPLALRAVADSRARQPASLFQGCNPYRPATRIIRIFSIARVLVLSAGSLYFFYLSVLSSFSTIFFALRTKSGKFLLVL